MKTIDRSLGWTACLSVLVMLVCAAVPVQAGKNAGGAMVVHTDDTYSWTGNVCSKFDDWVPQDCESLNTRTDKDEYTPALIWFIAAFPDTSNPGVTVAYFGIDHNLPAYYIDRRGYCGPSGTIEVPDTGWPDDTDAGNSVAFGSPITGERLFPFYWLSAYGFTDAYLSTAINPTGAYAAFVDDSNPPVQDDVTDFGVVRWYSEGSNSCPSAGGGLDGGGVVPPDGGEGDSEGTIDGDDPDAAVYNPPDDPSNVVSAYIMPDAISLRGDGSAPVGVEAVDFLDVELRRLLLSLGAQTLRKSFPGRTLADTTGYDTRGRPVRLPDISGFYSIEFRTPEEAISAVPALWRTPAVRIAEVVGTTPVSVCFPNDPYFDSWHHYPQDAQWNLQNDGLRSSDYWNPDCLAAVEGADIKIQGAWVTSLGDNSTVIGVVDTGILGGTEGSASHEDLRVVTVSDADREQISNHPESDWCTTHGTRMAGFAGARTNNSIGVAGVCGNCSFLDIEAARCHPDFCEAHSETWCAGITNFHTLIENALHVTLPEGMVLRVFNLSFGARATTPKWLPIEEVLPLWRAFASNRVLVAATTNLHSTEPTTTYPVNLPFVLGAGGSTWRGEFWDNGTSCYEDEAGTLVGYSEWPEGGRIVDVCAPASGTIVTTEPELRQCGDELCYYWHSSVRTSGATAQTSGVAGLIQSIAVQMHGGDLYADDVIGIIEASATPWPADNHPSTYSVCPTCPPEYFGNGILNAEAAVELVTDYWDSWRSDENPDLCERVAKKTNGDIIPGTWSFTEIYSENLNGTMWYQYKAQADIQIPELGSGPPPRHLPNYIAWVRRLSPNTNTFASYSNNLALRLDMMNEEVHDCRMTVIDQETGVATISGHTFAWRDGETGELHFEVSEEDVRMAYVVLCNYCVGVADRVGDSNDLGARIASVACPSGMPVGFRLVNPQVQPVMVEVFDVAGRCIRRITLGTLGEGTYWKEWDGKTDGGGKAKAGVYWIRVGDGGSNQPKKLILVR